MRSRDVPRPVQIEWPTVAIVLAIWASVAGLAAMHDRIPAWIAVPAFALLGAWYMSVQHEATHGHPTPWRWVNLLLMSAPLALWLPYGSYEESHLHHHESDLTSPGDDPESYLVTPEQYERAGRVRRALWTFHLTLVGRLLLGPVRSVCLTLSYELRRANDARIAIRLTGHLLFAGVIGGLLFGVAKMPAWEYVLGFCYAGMSLSLIRSFAEHRPVDPPADRSAVVQSGRFFSTLFLFNNLHHAHHALPNVAWYRLPQLADDLESAAIAASGAGCYRGYGELFRRYAVRPLMSPVAPSRAARASATR